jgi:phosphoribosyl-AMP cyclohydrolase
MITTPEFISNIDFEKGNGLVPVIIQDAGTSTVLMLGYMNKEALEQTILGGVVIFWSRSRKEFWTKGHNSGNTLVVKSIEADCDNDTLLIRVEFHGSGVCHTGSYTCFINQLL